ncbi:MAG: phytase [Nocardioidaceae bacterium]|nr:phytase [Nocardioidaceae bacterium]
MAAVGARKYLSSSIAALVFAGVAVSVTTALAITETPQLVTADVETAPVSHSGDAADDPSLWVHPTNPGQSLLIGNDKQGALEVYNLDGSLQQRITTAASFWGNSDVRQQVTIGARTLDVVAAYNGGLRLYTVDTATRTLRLITDGTGKISTAGEGLCLYRSSTTGDLSAFVISRAGRVRQFRIFDGDGDGLLQGQLQREFEVGSEAEGCVADDVTGALYVSEEDVALWRYGAEPEAGNARTEVDQVQPDGHLTYDIEGLTLVEQGTSGYLIASAQNGAKPSKSYFVVYDRQTNLYEKSFRITSGTDADGCQRTDGITAYAGNLGAAFPQGVFVCQDNANTTPGSAGNQNFKLTRLERILELTPITG